MRERGHQNMVQIFHPLNLIDNLEGKDDIKYYSFSIRRRVNRSSI